ncbi:Protein kinase-like domain protein [Niveomyces insectorum RCEF 264]|uniref:non-specific serine/threonine protein kinase n=1 Tax=Niveomyces insectorum RCEF 264 TaxID=1081102 RepID=A0A167SEQ6_9HYPO|nr:Protein kinase-like domain protein [Niveomyces insectorum RCEF 264]
MSTPTEPEQEAAEARAKARVLCTDMTLTFKQRMRQHRIKRGLRVSPEPESDTYVPPEGVTILYQFLSRRVTRHPGGVVRKSSKGSKEQEAEALRVAEAGGVPVPHVHGTGVDPADGWDWLAMDYVDGQPLSELWDGMTAADKSAVAGQLRAILQTMRAMPPPPQHIGGMRAGDPLRDLRAHFPHAGPACRDEAAFNAYLLSDFHPQTAKPIRAAFARRLRTDHRVVLTHGDLAPRNVLVKDGTVVALIDWEEAGWYPEYWEYVKFFQRNAASQQDWCDYADEIFPVSYPDEWVDYTAISRYQSP